MKKIISASVLFVCLCLNTTHALCRQDSTTAQYDNTLGMSDGNNPHHHAGKGQPRVAFGIEAGLNFSTLNIDGNSSDLKAGAVIGVLADIRMFGRFYLQPGVFYVNNGGGNISQLNGDVVDWNINSIEVPINIEYKTGRPGATHFIFGVGVYFGRNIGGNVTIGPDENSQVRSADNGIGINIGVELKNGLFFRIREEEGLSNMQPTSYYYNSASSIYSVSDAITVGYLFGKKPMHKGRAHHTQSHVDQQPDQKL